MVKYVNPDLGGTEGLPKDKTAKVRLEYEQELTKGTERKRESMQEETVPHLQN